MGRPENASWVSPTALLCVVFLLQGHTFAKTISLSYPRSSSSHQNTNLWDFDQIRDENFAAEDYTMGHSPDGVTSLHRGNNGKVGEPNFDNSLGSYFYSMTTTPMESLRDELSPAPPPPPTFSHAPASPHVELHPRLHYSRMGESFSEKAASPSVTSSSADSESELKWVLSPLDYLAIKQSRLRNTERQNYNKVNENEGGEMGSSSQQEQEAILSQHHPRSNGLGRSSSGHDDDDSNSDDVGRNGVKGYQGKVHSVFTSKTIKLETTPDFSASSSNSNTRNESITTTVGFDATIPSILIEVEKGRYDENQDKEGNPTSRITERSESNTHTTTTTPPFDLPYRVPFPYVSRPNNEEDAYMKAEGKPQNTNDMTDPSQTLLNKAVTLLQRRNRSRRDITGESSSKAVKVEEEEHETTVLQSEYHQHNSNETETATESVDHSQVANVKNTTHAPSSNPLEALERLTRLLEKMLRQLSQFRQKFTLRLIRMTEREDMDQMQEIMKDFDISSEKPIFFIAGGLRKLNIDTRTTTTTSESEGNLPTVSEETGQQLIAYTGSQTVEQPHSTTTIGPLPSLPETTILPVEPETTSVDNERGSDILINRHNITTTTSNNSNVLEAEQISKENPSTTSAELLLSRHTRSNVEVDQSGFNLYTFPIPGRMARTENPYDDEEEYFSPYSDSDPSQNFDLRYDGDSDHVGASGETITSLNFSPLHPIHQSHGERNDYIKLDKAISSSGETISITPKLQKAAVPIISSSVSPAIGERFIPVDDSISKKNSNDQAHAAGLNEINLVSPSPFPSSNIDQENDAIPISIPASRNNQDENLNLASRSLIENRVLNPVLASNPILLKSETNEAKNPILELNLYEAQASSRVSENEQTGVINPLGIDKKKVVGSEALSQQDNGSENKALDRGTNSRVAPESSENIPLSTQNKLSMLPGNQDQGNVAKVGSPVSTLSKEMNNPNHVTPRRSEHEENKSTTQRF